MGSLTFEELKKIADFVASHEITTGLGSHEGSCTIGSIHLALTGTLVARTPRYSSPVICEWVVLIQDHMPAWMRNSPEWEILIPPLANCGADPMQEDQRREIFSQWFDQKVLPAVQQWADSRGVGDTWRQAMKNGDIITDVRLFSKLPAAIKEVRLAKKRGEKSPKVLAEMVIAVSHLFHRLQEREEFWRSVDPVGLLADSIAVIPETTYTNDYFCTTGYADVYDRLLKDDAFRMQVWNNIKRKKD